MRTWPIAKNEIFSDLSIASLKTLLKIWFCKEWISLVLSILQASAVQLTNISHWFCKNMQYRFWKAQKIISKYQNIDIDYNIDQYQSEMVLSGLGHRLFCWFSTIESTKKSRSYPISTSKAQNSAKYTYRKYPFQIRNIVSVSRYQYRPALLQASNGGQTTNGRTVIFMFLLVIKCLVLPQNSKGSSLRAVQNLRLQWRQKTNHDKPGKA